MGKREEGKEGRAGQERRGYTSAIFLFLLPLQNKA